MALSGNVPVADLFAARTNDVRKPAEALALKGVFPGCIARLPQPASIMCYSVFSDADDVQLC